MTQFRSCIFLCAVCMFALSAAACQSPADNAKSIILPSTELDPVEVVQIQLAALKANGPDNDGIAQTFEFASPINKLSTGPLDRFAILFDGELYSAMLNHLKAEIFTPYIENDLAIVPVALVAIDGTEWRYLFVLTRQRVAPYENMWMTDAVQLESQAPRVWA